MRFPRLVAPVTGHGILAVCHGKSHVQGKKGFSGLGRGIDDHEAASVGDGRNERQVILHLIGRRSAEDFRFVVAERIRHPDLQCAALLQELVDRKFPEFGPAGTGVLESCCFGAVPAAVDRFDEVQLAVIGTKPSQHLQSRAVGGGGVRTSRTVQQQPESSALGSEERADIGAGDGILPAVKSGYDQFFRDPVELRGDFQDVGQNHRRFGKDREFVHRIQGKHTSAFRIGHAVDGKFITVPADVVGDRKFDMAAVQIFTDDVIDDRARFVAESGDAVLLVGVAVHIELMDSRRCREIERRYRTVAESEITGQLKSRLPIVFLQNSRLLRKRHFVGKLFDVRPAGADRIAQSGEPDHDFVRVSHVRAPEDPLQSGRQGIEIIALNGGKAGRQLVYVECDSAVAKRQSAVPVFSGKDFVTAIAPQQMGKMQIDSGPQDPVILVRDVQPVGRQLHFFGQLDNVLFHDGDILLLSSTRSFFRSFEVKVTVYPLRHRFSGDAGG